MTNEQIVEVDKVLAQKAAVLGSNIRVYDMMLMTFPSISPMGL